ncbi:hypothetical protein [Roseomonas indoligenes]|uniref:DegT/DnrJ/EryC1/StrS aminotransferase family protein n=1 Tax=Roseomonas indoligenes TaxID=2820811 RepID=A0A940MTS3_9PROT|nr:hypothetical protein [Pararoseomonas indoligenes]MBP0491543.1 hypothetical protein [Pararoseomonas indoligenes]
MTGAIGGFLPLDPGPPLGKGGRESVARRWFRGVRHHGFRNGRSALALGAGAALGPFGMLWMPGYACRALADAAEAALRLGHARRLATYPLALEGALSPDPRFLAAHLEPGDAVLVISYFGRPPSASLRRLAAVRRDVTWIEDRAGALWPGPAWGDALLYSPRKLLGVSDGGYLVLTPRGSARARPLPEQPARPGPAEAPPALRRFEHEGGSAAWFPAYRAAEGRMAVSPGAPARLTDALLARQDLRAIAAARRANHAVLRPLIPPDLLLEPAPDRPAWVPQGLPLRVPDAAALSARMAEKGVFCPVMWPDPADPGPCARSRALKNRVLLLPLDQRYGGEEMRRVASVLEAAVSGTGSAAPLAA